MFFENAFPEWLFEKPADGDKGAVAIEKLREVTTSIVFCRMKGEVRGVRPFGNTTIVVATYIDEAARPASEGLTQRPNGLRV